MRGNGILARGTGTAMAASMRPRLGCAEITLPYSDANSDACFNEAAPGMARKYVRLRGKDFYVNAS